MSITIYKKILNFTFAAGTSRGYYTKKVTYLVKITDESGFEAYGECSALPGLSCDFNDNYEDILKQCALDVMAHGHLDRDRYKACPSVIFGFETALLHLAHKSLCLFDSPFCRSQEGLVINGLVWMGDFETMLQRLESKIADGFKCIKIKIGAIDFQKELLLLKSIRSRFDADTIEIRVDANGAFNAYDAETKLKDLSAFNLHSIEQPVMKGQTELMRKLCALEIIPVALDEELIGIHDIDAKREILEDIKPDYIVLKPSLHGGFSGCSEFIHEAKKRNIGYWLTSALESNIGLNAVAQYASMQDINIPQGLGTGLLYDNNIDYPLFIKGQMLHFNAQSQSLVDYKGFLSDCEQIL